MYVKTLVTALVAFAAAPTHAFSGQHKVTTELLNLLFVPTTTTTTDATTSKHREDVMVRFPSLPSTTLRTSVSSKLSESADYNAATASGTMEAMRLQRAYRRLATQEVLKDWRDEVQEEALTALNSLGYKYTSFWINNAYVSHD